MAQHQDHHEVDAHTGVSTTGHEWDGIRELNTPLPRWWLGIFYATIVWSVGYWVVYPAWPLITGATQGVIGYASRIEIAKDLALLQQHRASQSSGLAEASLEQIKADPSLFRIAMAQGKAAFGDNCAACHGVGGAGSKGYPNLNDDDWLWGGSLAEIHQTLQNGIRVAGNAETRISQMPAFGKDGVLKPAEIRAVANHVRELAGLPTEANADLAKGRELFATNCAACHGVGGAGSKGYPNLNDDDWLWGGSLAEIHQTLQNGIRVAGNAETRISQMPAFGKDGVLKPAEIRAVANHVRELAGLSTEPTADLAKGRELFATNCAACHGDAGKGNKELGAPNLTDAISLYGMDLASLTETITNSRAGVMPAWGQRLDPTTVKALTIYVHSLGGGQ